MPTLLNDGDELGFEIERKEGPEGVYHPIGKAGENRNEYTDTHLRAGITYFCRVRPSDADGYSASSNEIRVKISAYWGDPDSDSGHKKSLCGRATSIGRWSILMGQELKLTMKKMVRTLVVFTVIFCLLSFSFCVNGKPPKYFQTDDRFRATIIGTWVGVHDQIISENTYLEDGTAKMLLMGPGPEKKVLLSASGSWEIKARQLVKTVKETSDPENLPLGKVSTYDIVSITDERMTLIAEDGMQISSVRKTQKVDEKERRELAEELLTVMKIKNLIERMFDQVKQATISQLKTMNNSEQSGVDTQRITQDLMDLLDKELSWENAKEEYVTLYAQEFNEEELRGLIDFHKSPLGHKLLEKMPDLMRKSIQTGQRRTAKIMPRIRKAIDEIQKETERKHKEDSLGEMIFFEVREQL